MLRSRKIKKLENEKLELDNKINLLEESKIKLHSLILKSERSNNNNHRNKAISFHDEANDKLRRVKKEKLNVNQSICEIKYKQYYFLGVLFLILASSFVINELIFSDGENILGAFSIQACSSSDCGACVGQMDCMMAGCSWDASTESCSSSSSSSSSSSGSSGGGSSSSSSSGSSGGGRGNNAPSFYNLTLNTTNLEKNSTIQNLTLYWNSFDLDGDLIRNITNWFVNGDSLTVLNMPFERINATNSSNAWDYSGHGNNGSVKGAIWNLTGGYGGKGAYMFNGSNDYIAIGDSSELDAGLNQLTVAAWVYPKDLSSNHAIVSKWQRFGTTNRSYSLFVILGNIIFSVENSSDDSVSASNNTALSTNSWQYVVGTWNGSKVKLYVNGEIADEKNLTGAGVYDSTAGLAIGKVNTNENYYYFNGTIDEVEIYNRSLSKEQIVAIFNNKTGLFLSQETEANEIWKACVTPNDGNEDGSIKCTNNLTIRNSLPNITSLILNTTDISNNDTNQNLTAYWSTNDVDNDLVKDIANWFVNGSSITVLNMPFEKINGTNIDNAWDYSGFGNNGSVRDATWNATAGYDGKGAYEFDGVNDYIISNVSDWTASDYSVSLWVKASSVGQNKYSTMINNYNRLGGSGGGDSFQIDVDGEDPGTYRMYMSSSKSVDFGTVTTNWTYLVATYNGSHVTTYFNGDLANSNLITGNAGNVYRDYVVGRNRNNNKYFNGTIDEIKIYNLSLSSNQVNAFFNNHTDLIVSNETEVNDVWKICVTLNDGTEDGDISCSNNVTILSQSSNSLPTVPILTSLINGSTTTDRTPTLAWNNSVDNNGDIISYNLIIDDNPAFNNPEVNVTSVVNASDVNTTYGLSTVLDVDTNYFWKVAANDSYGYGAFSEAGNFTVQSYLSFSLLTSSVSFGNVNNSGVLNTTDNDPLPFRGENTGNIKQNITLNASRMFTAINYPSSSYMFKIRANESGAFNSSLSRVTWQNFSKTSSDVHVVNLNWLSFKDDFLVDLNLSIPSNETAGEKTSTVTFSIE